MWRLSLFSVAALLGTGCASLPGAPMPTAHEALFAPEIVRARVLDAYEAVARLRPAFLMRRAATLPPSIQLPVVFLDNLRFGGVDALRSIPIGEVVSIRYVAASDANFRWGNTYPAGVILVTTTKTADY